MGGPEPNRSQLAGPFVQGGVGGADGLGVYASGFGSVPGTCNPVYGGSVGPAVGVGAGGYLGVSDTIVDVHTNPIDDVEHWISSFVNPFGWGS